MAEEKVNNMGEFVKALIKFRAALKQPKKDAVNPFFNSKYATLDSVVAAIDEACAEAELSYVQMTGYDDGEFYLLTTVMHASGEFVKGKYILPATGKPQEIGAALTYARRYALSAAFGIVADDDDDGNSAAVVKSGDEAMFERDKRAMLECQNIDALKTYYEAVKLRKDKFNTAQYAELVNVAKNMNDKLKEAK